MPRRRRRAPRKRRTEAAGARIGRFVNRVLIAVAFGLVALYLIPLSTKVAQPVEERGEVAESAPWVPAEPVTVQVLNGAGKAGLALDVTRFLRENRCDVVEMGNADHFKYETTRIIARTEDRAAAEYVRSVLGVGEVASDPDPELLLQVTLIIGADCFPFPPAPPAE